MAHNDAPSDFLLNNSDLTKEAVCVAFPKIIDRLRYVKKMRDIALPMTFLSKLHAPFSSP